MKLAFYSRDGHTVYYPGPRTRGQPDRCIGRSFVYESDAKGGVTARRVAMKEADVVDTAHLSSSEVEDVKRAAKKASIWPADKATAEFCSVDLVSVSQDADGEWVADKRPPAKPVAAKAEAKKES